MCYIKLIDLSYILHNVKTNFLMYCRQFNGLISFNIYIFIHNLGIKLLTWCLRDINIYYLCYTMLVFSVVYGLKEHRICNRYFLFFSLISRKGKAFLISRVICIQENEKWLQVNKSILKLMKSNMLRGKRSAK